MILRQARCGQGPASVLRIHGRTPPSSHAEACAFRAEGISTAALATPIAGARRTLLVPVRLDDFDLFTSPAAYNLLASH